VGWFVRRVPTASGATAVQIVHKRGRVVVDVEHIGSAHDDAGLELLLHVAHERLHAGQQVLGLELSTANPQNPADAVAVSARPVVEATGSLILWQALANVYDALGFAVMRDEAFKALVLGRIIEPTSKVDTIRVLGEVGVKSPSRATFQRCLRRIVERDYRETVSHACYTHATRGGGLALVLYDLTTLYFETPREDGLRKVGMSKERRVDPQVTVGLLTDKTGFPLAVHLFEGNKAETKTVVPVLTAFREQHADAKDIVVVADAGMLSAANLTSLEEAGFSFIVGSKTSKAPYDLATHLERHGNAFDDGQTIEATRTMGTGKSKRGRRVVWQWSRKRYRHDIQAINAMVDRAEAVAAGTRAVKKDRFVTLGDADPTVDWNLVKRAQYLAGLKGYVTNVDADTLDGPAVVVAYHDLYQVERSFRMTKTDLAARPVFHRLRDSIEAHLTVVFAALAVSREAQARTGLSINKILKTLRPLRTATVTIGRQQITAEPRIPAEAQTILNDLTQGGH
jgi:hypothetical protein